MSDKFPMRLCSFLSSAYLTLGLVSLPLSLSSYSSETCDLLSSFPLDSSNRELFNLSPGLKGPRDSDIIAAADIKYCSQHKGKTPSPLIDPHELSDDGSV
jgi:hypothetical protein